jgi:AcrR family transcriptional regulator
MSRQVQKEETRQRLLDAAFQVICEKGIMETRVSDIAQAAGVSHGALFVHFASLENLIAEAVETCGQHIALRTHELASQSTGLESLLRAHLAGISEHEPFYTRLVIENRLLPQAARDAWIGIQSAISFHFSRIVTREWPGADTALLFNTWMGLVHYYLINGDLFAPEGHVVSRYTDTLVAFYMKLTAGMAGEAKKEG